MKLGTLDESLAFLIENAYEIIADKKLFAIEKKLPKNTEPDFEKVTDAFAKYIQYEGDGLVYSQWNETAKSVLEQHGLQDSKFVAMCNMFDPQTESNTPAHQFIRGLKELEKIRDNESYRSNYARTAYAQPLAYVNGLLKNGKSKHRFGKKYRPILKELMPNRKIMNSSGEIIREPKPITRDVLLRRHDLAPSDLHRLQRICAGIEGIEIKLSFPRKTDDVYLITTEDIR